MSVLTKGLATIAAVLSFLAAVLAAFRRDFPAATFYLLNCWFLLWVSQATTKFLPVMYGEISGDILPQPTSKQDGENEHYSGGEYL